MGDSLTSALDAQDRAFVESMVGISEKLEALKLVYTGPRHRHALVALQRATEAVTAAAITVQPL